jgi:hypothetical protein
MRQKTVVQRDHPMAIKLTDVRCVYVLSTAHDHEATKFNHKQENTNNKVHSSG